MKIIIGRWKIKEENIKDFVELSKEATIVSSREEGNISFTFSEIKSEENTFLFFEEWKNQDAIDFHISQDYFKDFMDKSKDMLHAKPIMKVYEVTNQTEL